jgi:uncharacterized protein YkwD
MPRVARGLAMRRAMRAAGTVLLPAGLLGVAGLTGAAGAAARTATSQHRGCHDASLRPTRTNVSRVVAATLCLIERERTTSHLSTLRANASLRRIAARQASEMVLGDYFGDNTVAGTTPWQRIATSVYASGAHTVRAAQNIGWGSGPLATPAAMVSAWMHSPAHRQIMLTGSYRDIGVGVNPAAPHSLTGRLPGATYTVEFAARG